MRFSLARFSLWNQKQKGFDGFYNYLYFFVLTMVKLVEPWLEQRLI
jgi:hypothetical protein